MPSSVEVHSVIASVSGTVTRSSLVASADLACSNHSVNCFSGSRVVIVESREYVSG